MPTFKVQANGKFREGAWHLDFAHYNNGKVLVRDTDTTKFYYEKGYEKTVSRVVKNKTVKYQNILFDLSEVIGVNK
jgi:hypothetical protein